MDVNILLSKNKSYWIAGIVAIFSICLLALTNSLTNSGEIKSLHFSTEYLASDKSTTGLGISSIKQEAGLPWLSFDGANIGLSDEPYWFRSSIALPVPNKHYLIEVDYGLLDKVELWFVEPESKAVVQDYTVGDSLPFSERPIQYEKFLFPLPSGFDELEVYFRIQSEGPIKAPIRVWEKSDFIEYSGAHNLFMGIFLGYMLAMALSNLFIYATTRNHTFAIYTGYVICFALVVATIHGVGFRYFWSEHVWLQQRAVAFFACATLFLIIQFSFSILSLKKASPLVYRVLNAVKYIFVILFFAAAVLPYTGVLQAILIMIAVTTPVILIAGISLSMNGNLIARYFTAAWAVLLVSGITTTIENLGVFELEIDASYLLMVGATIETMLLALALAISFSDQFKETELARAAAIENERQAMVAKDELLKVQEEAKRSLQYSVEERTLELEIALRELSEANNELERMSAIDPLTGLMNRRYFDKRLLAEMRRSRREQTPLTVAILDIDFFKKVNDKFGHLGGDECLKVFSRVLQDIIKRPADVICRFGGEEFVAILPNTELEGACKLMQRLRLAVEDTVIKFEDKEIRITVSIGVTSRVVESNDEQEMLIAFADKLLYQAKQSGRNKVVSDTF
ncbi:sensor domain-containing diguanylate cyclase [Agaribacter flavus]|uniref:diguanylate cyclase n=1 Tax=Agaribacter flavus TaxID=1902781 RepID=A0ABV7FT77_9ALTE